MTSNKSRPEIVRTTLDRIGEIDLPRSGVYILAYMGRVVYVGISRAGVDKRIIEHVRNAESENELLGRWIGKNTDHLNIRLDVIVEPDDAPANWLRNTEALCINEFNPVLNTNLTT